MLGPGDRIVAQQDVAHGAAAKGGEEGDEGNAKQIHVAPPSGQCSGHGFGGNGNDKDIGKHQKGPAVCYATPSVRLPESLRSFDCLPLRWVVGATALQLAIMEIAVPGPERLWEFAPSAGAAMAPLSCICEYSFFYCH